MGVPMMVDSDWLAAVDAFVRANAEGVPAPANVADSRFYDVRPAVLRTRWKWDDDASSWTAKIRFIVNGEQATEPSYDVYAPMFRMSEPPVTNYSPNPNVFVVWRGRWEIISFAPIEYVGGDGINVSGRTINTSAILGAYLTNVETSEPQYLKFDGRQFVRSDGGTDGPRTAISIKLKQIQVVTGVELNTDGTLNVTTSNVMVVDGPRA